MKKIIVALCSLLCLVSCQLDGPSGFLHANREGLITLCQMDGDAAGYPYSLLQQLYCVHLYRTYDGPDRNSQWFSRLGKCYTDGNELKTEFGNMRVLTNGMNFTESGSVYDINGYVFTCSNDGTVLCWSVKTTSGSKLEADMTFTVKNLTQSGMDLQVKGNALSRDYIDGGLSQTDYVRYDCDFVKPWTFAQTDISSDRNLLFPVTDRPKGECRCSVYHGSYGETDWVKVKLGGGQLSPIFTTSRD